MRSWPISVTSRPMSTACWPKGSCGDRPDLAERSELMDAESVRGVLDAVRTFGRKEVVSAEELIEETDEIPEAIRSKAAEMGLFGYALPEEYGGLGCTMTEDVELAMEFGHTTPAFRSMFGTNNGIADQKPLVAAVNGGAFGLGLSLAAACDYVVAREDARFVASFGRLGVTADTGLFWSLSQRTWPAQAKKMILFAAQA